MACSRLALAAALSSAMTSPALRADDQPPAPQPAAAKVVNWAGTAHAWLDLPQSQGQVIEFTMTFGPEPGRVVIHNAGEDIAVPIVKDDGKTLTLRFDDYDSEIRATRVDEEGRELVGEWVKRRGPANDSAEFVRLPFRLNARGYCPMDGVNREQSAATEAAFQREPRWLARFEGDEDAAVLVFSKGENPHATFLTTTGDYRFLTPVYAGNQVRLSCFDGSHAFLFVATLRDDRLTGDFWSGPKFHTTWTATPDADAKLPDGFGIAKVTPGMSLNDLTFTGLDAKPASLGDAAFAGKCRVIEVFGTWCPNCKDATNLMKQFHARYRDKGLSMVGLAFEVTGDERRDLEQVRIYRDRHGVTFPLLLGGKSEKSASQKAFPVIDRVHAYPTLIFADAAGKIRAVYAGFSGPATGAEHAAMRERLERMIETMLAE